ncbi:hypothetical protein SLS62_006665 [Diatrype stigma]|uniref:Uncharacterized protein n=1 Tax=Diatrype stigma TaxID=117547 RepID=A0AAN9UY66_9PEZI
MFADEKRDNISVVESWVLTDPYITSHVPGWIGVQTLDLDEMEMIHFDVVPSRYYGSSDDAALVTRWAIYLFYLAYLAPTGDEFPDVPDRSIWRISGMAHFPFLHANRGAWAYGDKHRFFFGEDIADLDLEPSINYIQDAYN